MKHHIAGKRCVRQVFLAFIAFGVVGPTVARVPQQPVNDKLFDARLAELSDRYIASRKKGNLEEERFVNNDEARRAMATQIESYLNAGSPPSTEELARRISDSFARLDGYPSFQAEQQTVGTETYAYVINDTSSQFAPYIVGIREGLVGPVTWAFAASQKEYHLTAQAGTDMEGYALGLAQVSPVETGVTTFLAYGNRIGASHYPVKVVLYQFDGRTFQTLWTQDDLLEGDVKVSGSEIVLTHLDSESYQSSGNQQFIREKYSVTHKGMELESREWVTHP